MKFSEFAKQFLGIDLHWYQEMMLDGDIDPTGMSAQIHARNSMKTVLRNLKVAEAILEGKEILVVCSSEEAAKRTYEDLVKFFEMVKENA